MNISKNSWHYRFNSWKTSSYKTKKQKSLCPYFWFTVWNLLSVLAIVAFLTVMALGIMGGIGVIITRDVLGVSNWWALLTGPVGTAILVGIVYLLVVGLDKLNDKRRTWSQKRAYAKWEEEQKELPKKEPGLVKSFMKAHHSKICPMLEFKE